MRPYKRNGPCPKCGLTSEVDMEGKVTQDISTRFVSERQVILGEDPGMVGERLARICGCCGYGWTEACVSTQAESDQKLSTDTAPPGIVFALEYLLAQSRELMDTNAQLTVDLENLYDSEINFTISSFWDGGFTFRLGDSVNGYTGECGTSSIQEGVNWLVRAAQERYPNSEFAKARSIKVDTGATNHLIVNALVCAR